MVQYQRGMTIWSWLFVLGTIGFAALIGMTLFPIYMENMSVKKAVNQVGSSDTAASLNRKSAYAALVKQFYIDQVSSVKEEDISIETNDDDVKELIVAYEVRKPIMFNVDVVVWFEERKTLKE